MGTTNSSFSLCTLCDKASKDKCRWYKEDPKALVKDCGRFKPDPAKTSLTEATEAVMKQNYNL